MRWFHLALGVACLLGWELVWAQEAELKKISFIPQWLPQAQFAGYYVALEKGIYRKYGVDVTILRGGPTRSPSELLSNGQADFGTFFLSTGIVKHAREGKLINIAQMVQKSSLMLVAKKSSGISSPKDLQGKKVSLWSAEFQVQPQMFFRKYGLSVTVVPQTATVNLFLRGGVDAASAMWYNEYHTIMNAGVNPEELTTFFFSDGDLNFPEDGIYCTRETYEKDPLTCQQFVKASIEGWRYVFDHSEEALDIVIKYAREAGAPEDRSHQRWMLSRMREVMFPRGLGTPLGLLQPTDYNRVAHKLLGSRLIDHVPEFSHFFIPCVSQ